MQRSLALICLCIVLPLFTSAPLAAQGLPQEFTSAYRPALEIIKQTYTNATIEGTLKQDFPQAGRSVQQQFVLRSKGPWFRLDATAIPPKSSRAKTGGTQVFLATPDASLQTYQTPGNQMFDFSSIKEDSYGEAKTRIRDLCPINYAYSFDNQTSILDMLQSGNVRITSFKTGKLNDQRMFQINYLQEVDPDGQQGPWTCSILISPEEGYAMRQYSRTTGRGDAAVTIRGSLSYGLDHNGIPLVERIERRREQGARAALIQRDNLNITSFNTQTPDMIYFGADGM
jgi:hypothetical protein